MSTINLAKVDARNRLAPRRDSYWQRIEAGCFLGYRKMAADVAGTWLARSRDAVTGKQLHKPLGEFSEYPAHTRFDIAGKAARHWFAHVGRGGKAVEITVKTACERYVQYLSSAGR